MKAPHLPQSMRVNRPGLDWPGWSFAFLACSFLGWIFETTFVWRQTGQFTNRGYLTVLGPFDHYLPALRDVPLLGSLPMFFGLPIIEMYGLGGVIIIATLHSQRTHPVRVFCFGFVVLTLFELAASYLSTFLLHREFWDYSTDYVNFQGRICLRSSMAWGILSVMTIDVLDPFLDRVYEHQRGRRFFKVALVVLMAYAAVCALLKYWLAPGLFQS